MKPPQSHFVDGLGWVVKCSQAVRYVAAVGFVAIQMSEDVKYKPGTKLTHPLYGDGNELEVIGTMLAFGNTPDLLVFKWYGPNREKWFYETVPVDMFARFQDAQL